MLSIISSAKSLDFATNALLNSSSSPQFIDDTQAILNIVKILSLDQLQQIMRTSRNIAALNYQRFVNFASLPHKQALLAYDGDVYKQIDKHSIQETHAKFLQSHILIISGLYGALRPLDLIRPYRMEMCVNLHGIGHLTAFWQLIITSHINRMLSTHDTQYLINLASAEYSAVIDRNILQYPMINIHFKELQKNGTLKSLGLNTKQARGKVVNYIIQNCIDTPNQLKYLLSDYYFDTKISTEFDWVFIKTSPAH